MSLHILAENKNFRELNTLVKAAAGDVCIDGCCGQSFIGAALKGRSVTINGTPGNALGAYLDGGAIVVHGNAQDAVGDTMNDGEITVHGSAGDALGYAMRGGKIFVRGDAGYRAGIHMKEYAQRKPVLVIGGCAGSFLGEYLAGGVIVVLGIGARALPVGNFTGTGMHGGEIFIRSSAELKDLPEQVSVSLASAEDLRAIAPHISEFTSRFGGDPTALLRDRFYKLSPNAKNPYKQLYAAN